MLTYIGNALINPTYEAIKADFGILRPEYILLACLAHYKELTAQDVCFITRQPRNTMSRAVHRALAEGYIAREPDPSDARQAKLTLTTAGRDLHEKAQRYVVARQEKIFASLANEERAALSALLREIVRHVATLQE